MRNNHLDENNHLKFTSMPGEIWAERAKFGEKGLECFDFNITFTNYKPLKNRKMDAQIWKTVGSTTTMQIKYSQKAPNTL